MKRMQIKRYNSTHNLVIYLVLNEAETYYYHAVELDGKPLTDWEFDTFDEADDFAKEYLAELNAELHRRSLDYMDHLQ